MSDERYNHHRNCHHSMYRLTCEDFNQLYEYAKGCCQICKTPEADTKRGKLVIDHAPRYGFIAVRGLLCDKCNSLMSRADAGVYVAEAFRYWQHAWFTRVLLDRYRSGFPEHVRKRYLPCL